MKAKWLFASAVVVLSSCEKPAPIIAEKPERKKPSSAAVQENPPEPASPAAPAKSPAPSVAESPPPPKDAPVSPAPQPPPRPGIPEAIAVPNQPGFVFSPHNGKIVDVRDIPSGTLVADPTFPAEEKKHFRVP